MIFINQLSLTIFFAAEIIFDLLRDEDIVKWIFKQSIIICNAKRL